MVYRLNEIAGTVRSNSFFGQQGNIYLGLGGNDSFRGNTNPIEAQIFVGGSGNDSYVINTSNTLITVVKRAAMPEILLRQLG